MRASDLQVSLLSEGNRRVWVTDIKGQGWMQEERTTCASAVRSFGRGRGRAGHRRASFASAARTRPVERVRQRRRAIGPRRWSRKHSEGEALSGTGIRIYNRTRRHHSEEDFTLPTQKRPGPLFRRSRADTGWHPVISNFHSGSIRSIRFAHGHVHRLAHAGDLQGIHRLLHGEDGGEEHTHHDEALYELH